MPRHPSPLPDPLEKSGFSVQDARAAGITRARLRAADLHAPFHGIRTGDAPTDTLARATAYLPLLRPGQHFSHLTAARLLGLRMPKGAVAPELHVTALAPQRAPRTAGTVGHRATSASIVHVGNLPVSDPVSTWCDLASMLQATDLVAMGDGLLSRKRPVATVPQLQNAVASRAGQRGARRLAAALERIRPGTDSPMETVLRLLLIDYGLPEPAVNLPIRNRFGAVIAHADLAYSEHRVVVEYDGGHHRTDEAQYNIDIDRLDELMEEGWRVIRVNKNVLARRATLIGKVRTTLANGAPSPR